MSEASSVRLARPELGDAELAQVAQVFASGQLTLGAKLLEFERAIAEATQSPFAIGCANGTAALHLALLALDIGPGDEVVVPAYTFPATSNVVLACGATPVFCDVRSDCDVTDAALIERALSPRTRAIMVVHLFGFPAGLRDILELATARDIPVIEDAAGALGSIVDGAPAGSLGTMGCFSLHPRKIITTGEGGAVVTADRALAERLRRLRHHGIGPDGFADIGLNYRLPDILAAIALPQLAQLESLVAERERLAQQYDEALEALPGIRPAPRPAQAGDRHSWQAYVSRVDDASKRDELIAAMRAGGVESQVGTYCVPALTPYASRGFQAAATPNAVAAADSGIALPLYDGLTTDEQQRVIDCLERALTSVGLVPEQVGSGVDAPAASQSVR